MTKKILLLIAFLLLSPLQAQATDWTSDANCMGAWLMEDDGNETDVAQGNTLVETSGDIPQDADEVFGTYSRDFERNDTEWLAHADGLDTDINGADQNITLCAWIKQEVVSWYSTWYYIIGKWEDGGSTDNQYALYTNYNRLKVKLSSDGNSQFDFDSPTSDVGTNWVHVAFVYNDVVGIVYQNGVNIKERSYTSGIYNGTANFQVGSLGINNSYHDGLIDDVGVFDDAKSSTDINDIMDNGLYEAAAGRTRRFF